MTAIFFDTEHNLRSGWKFAAFVVLFLMVWVIAGTVLSIFISFTRIPGEIDLAILALNAAALFVPAVLATIVMARSVDRVPASSFGTALHEGWLGNLSAGVVLAAAMLAALLAGSFLLADVTVAWTAGSPVTWVATFLILLFGAANEELVFRGYPMQVLMKGIGVWPAMLAMSGLFGLLHARNPDATLLGVVNTIFAGLLLSVAYLKTRSLWLSYGIHVAWNVGLGIVLGFPVSGIELVSLMTTRTEGPEILVGGQYGPEGGLLGTAVFLAAIAVVMTRRGFIAKPS